MAENMFNSWNQPESDERVELVFADRFKGYGAYQIRTLYRRSKVLATIAACALVSVIAATPLIITSLGAGNKGKPKVKIVVTTLDDVKPPEEEEEKPKDPPKTKEPEPIASTQYVVPKINPKAKADDPVTPPDDIPNPGATTKKGAKDPFAPEDGGSGGSPLDPPGSGEPLTKVDIQASYPGGDAKFIEYVSSAFEYPPRCQEENINGYVLLRFVVDVDGSISNVKAVDETKACPEFTQEAFRILKKSPRWIPAQNNGTMVKAWRQIPIKLTLQ
ncbi:MAG: TonB family protein [Bacteroidetes bacterium]|nr:TonB family protein [Bacteroidota bacterium]